MRKNAESEHKVQKYIQIYVCLILVAAAMLVVLPSLFDKTYEYVTGMKSVVVFLAAACPCAIGMSVSTAFLGGILSAAKKGVIVKGGVYLELLAKVNTFLFDKTGTLTEGVFEVQEYMQRNIRGKIVRDCNLCGKLFKPSDCDFVKKCLWKRT